MTDAVDIEAARRRGEHDAAEFVRWHSWNEVRDKARAIATDLDWCGEERYLEGAERDAYAEAYRDELESALRA